jgi:hemoglobin
VREPKTHKQEDAVAEEKTNLATPSGSSTRRDLLAQAAAMLSVGSVAGTFTMDPAVAAQPQSGRSLYDRLGGIFAIAAVVNYFSDEVIKDPVAGARSANPRLRHWSTEQLDRLPGLKFMRTLWVAAVSGGPYHFTPTRPGATPLGLENAHRALRISPQEFDAVAGVLSRSLDHFHVGKREKAEVLGAFAAHKGEVTLGYRQAHGRQR